MENHKIKQQQLNNNELTYFCSQMALILHSGISTLEGISMMMDDNADKRDTQILTALQSRMEAQGLLYLSLKDVGVFPDYMINMVRIGEETGTLDDVMEALAKHYEREENIRSSISHAVFYPIIMAGMILAVIVVLLVQVMPLFSQVFTQLGTELTGIAAGLVQLGDIISRYSFVFIIVVAAIIAFILICVKTKAGKKIARMFGGIRDLSLRIAASRFADGMSLTLKSGLDSGRSFELVSSLNEDPVFTKRLEKCTQLMNQGESLADSLHDSGIFTGVYSRMASVGNKAGAMDNVMGQIADLYQEEVDTKINNMLSVVEPTLIIILSVIVGVILMSVMFPLLGLMSSI